MINTTHMCLSSSTSKNPSKMVGEYLANKARIMKHMLY